MGLLGSREEVLEASMAWMDVLWDDDAGLLWTVKRDRHMTRETAWYALGLFARGDRTDHARAARALLAVCDQQYDTAGTDVHGTWRRAPEEGDVPDDPVMWIHYDPNWRQFIGTTFAVILDRYDVGDALAARMRTAIERAVDGEGADRVSPHYANIALMKAWLDAWAGRTSDADAFARRIDTAFDDDNGAFLEYNSPTYYGVDLWALALWRSSTPQLQEIGARIEAALWRDLTRFYHPGFRTQCGPFDRSYGMDMTTHATPLGLWIWSAVGREHAPFPDGDRFQHPHDFCFGTCVASFDAGVPTDVLGDLTTFGTERVVEQLVGTDPRRVATAWLSEDVMFGGWSGPPSGIGILQHRHATIHWRRPTGGTGWIYLRPDIAADVTVEHGEMRITAGADALLAFEAHPSLDMDAAVWTSDGLSLSVRSDGPTTVLTAPGGK